MVIVILKNGARVNLFNGGNIEMQDGIAVVKGSGYGSEDIVGAFDPRAVAAIMSGNNMAIEMPPEPVVVPPVSYPPQPAGE